MRLILLLACPIFALTIGDIGPVRDALGRAYLHSDMNQQLRILRVSKEFDDYKEVADAKIRPLFKLSGPALDSGNRAVAAIVIECDTTKKIMLRFPDSASRAGMYLQDFMAFQRAGIFKVVLPKEKEEQ